MQSRPSGRTLLVQDQVQWQTAQELLHNEMANDVVTGAQRHASQRPVQEITRGRVSDPQ